MVEFCFAFITLIHFFSLMIAKENMHLLLYFNKYTKYQCNLNLNKYYLPLGSFRASVHFDRFALFQFFFVLMGNLPLFSLVWVIWILSDWLFLLNKSSFEKNSKNARLLSKVSKLQLNVILFYFFIMFGSLIRTQNFLK